MNVLSRMWTTRNSTLWIRMKISAKKTGIMLLQIPKGVYAASERQCTVACGDLGDGGKHLKYLGWYCSVLTKWELSNIAKLTVFKLAFVPILSCGHESWVMIEKMLSRVQVAETRFLRRVHGVVLRDKVHICEIRKDLNVEPLLRIEILYRMVWSRAQNDPRKNGETSPAGCSYGKVAQRSTKAVA